MSVPASMHGMTENLFEYTITTLSSAGTFRENYSILGVSPLRVPCENNIPEDETKSDRKSN